MDEFSPTKEGPLAKFQTVVVLVGPSGCGKTAVGQHLAQEIQATFLDADDFHTAAAKALMHDGHPLTDDQRHPWLERIRHAAVQASAQSVVVLACSALKPELREFLAQGNPNWKFVALEVEAAVLQERLARRTGHFFPATMLGSQLADWHPLTAEEGFAVDGNRSIAAITKEIRNRLHLGTPH